jgi:pilus assembly protein CpaC
LNGTVVGCCRALRALVVFAALTLASPIQAQQPPTVAVTPVDLPVGRSLPIRTTANVSRVSIVDPTVADVIVISENEIVINSIKSGETDAILWLADGSRLHYRIAVHAPSDRKQIAIAVKFAEVRRNAVRVLGLSGLYRDERTRIGTGIFNTDNAFDQAGGINLPATSRFITVLTDLGTDRVLAFLEAEETRGNARLLAEPNLLAGNKDSATFLAGGELPIPIVQPGVGGAATGGITVQYREFGIRLRFVGEIISDSLIKLTVTPEVSSLDFANAITLQGFRIPAFRTRRVTSTLDVKRDQSLIISGMFANEDEQVRTGVPFLKDIPIIGELFSSSQFQKNESELIVIVTPVIVDPMRPRAQDVLRLRPDTTRPAIEALRPRLPLPSVPPPPVRRP